MLAGALCMQKNDNQNVVLKFSKITNKSVKNRSLCSFPKIPQIVEYLIINLVLISNDICVNLLNC
jgi:hypothetical protein